MSKNVFFRYEFIHIRSPFWPTFQSAFPKNACTPLFIPICCDRPLGLKALQIISLLPLPQPTILQGACCINRLVECMPCPTSPCWNSATNTTTISIACPLHLLRCQDQTISTSLTKCRRGSWRDGSRGRGWGCLQYDRYTWGLCLGEAKQRNLYTS